MGESPLPRRARRLLTEVGEPGPRSGLKPNSPDRPAGSRKTVIAALPLAEQKNEFNRRDGSGQREIRLTATSPTTDRADENAGYIKKVFEELESSTPDGMR